MKHNLDRRIAIERATTGASNAFNEPSETWAELCSEWAAKKDVSDNEKVTAGQEYSALMSRFVVRSNANTRTVTTEDRISYDGIWDVRGVKELDRNRFIEITAQRRSD